MNISDRRLYVSVLHMSGEDRQDHIRRLKDRVLELDLMKRQFEHGSSDAAAYIPARIEACQRTLAILEGE
jgi:hypothetical protein